MSKQILPESHSAIQTLQAAVEALHREVINVKYGYSTVTGLDAPMTAIRCAYVTLLLDHANVVDNKAQDELFGDETL